MNQLFILATIVVLLSAIGLAAVHRDSPATVESSPGKQTAAPSSNAFAIDMYSALSKKDANANLFFSPFSMCTALAMTTEGARGQTRDEMDHVLHVSQSSLAAMHESLGQLTTQLSGKPVPDAIRKEISSLRDELNATNKKIEADPMGRSAMTLHAKAEEIAAKLNALLSQIDQYEFKSANALWAEKTFDFEKPYTDTISSLYKTGGLMPVDFLHDPDGSRIAINSWVSKQTNDRINDLLAPGQVRSDTRLVLTNAAYFKGEWSDPFDAAQTKRDDFFSADGTKSPVNLMNKWGPNGATYGAFNKDGSPFNSPDRIKIGDEQAVANYPADGGFLAAELPYKGGDLSMTIFLPRRANGLANFETTLTAELIGKCVDAMKWRKINVFLPKFRLETSYELSDALGSLGMKRAFINPAEPNSAQFDGISASSDPSKRLFIGAVVHKAFVDVNEKGTEAAAATAVAMMAGSAMPQMVPFVPIFRADHPFIFVIREKSTGTILFIGRVIWPPAAS